MGFLKNDEELGILNIQEAKDLAEYLEKKIKFKSWWAEKMDDYLAEPIVNAFDDFLLDKLPKKEVYKEDANAMVAAVCKEDWELAGDKAGNIAADLIPTPGIDETPMEDSLYDTLFITAIQWIVSKGKKEKERKMKA